MKIGPIELNFSSKQRRHVFSDEDRALADEVKRVRREIKTTELLGQLEKARQKLEDIKGDYGEEEGGLGEIGQLIQAFSLMQGGAIPGAGNPLAASGAVAGQGALQAPPANQMPPSPAPQPPVILNKDDLRMADEIIKRIPQKIKTMIDMQLVSRDYFLTLCNTVWQKLNTRKP